jgi:hypothetical protein
MKVNVEKKEIVGVVKTHLGDYNLLSLELHKLKNPDSDELVVHFHAVDDEGFETFITVHGDFLVMPFMIPEKKNVKVVLTDEEAQDLDKNELFDDKTDGQFIEPEEFTQKPN